MDNVYVKRDFMIMELLFVCLAIVFAKLVNHLPPYAHLVIRLNIDSYLPKVVHASLPIIATTTKHVSLVIILA